MASRPPQGARTSGGGAGDIRGDGLLAGRGTTSEALDLSGVVYFARAITPPGRSRRYDSRFFVASAEVIADIDRPPSMLENGELLRLNWVSAPEEMGLDLPLDHPRCPRCCCSPISPSAAGFRRRTARFPSSISRGKSWLIDDTIGSLP